MTKLLTSAKAGILLIFLLCLASSAFSGDPAVADYGDAPDNTYNQTLEAYPGITARFPTYFNTDNSGFTNYTGVYHINVDSEWIDSLAASGTTVENDALVETGDMDCLDVLLIYDDTDGEITGELLFPVTALTSDFRYINVLLDQDRDGDWRDSIDYLVKDLPIALYADSAEVLQLGPFPLNHETLSHWVRITLTRQPLNLPQWDGSIPPGGLEFGETEDHLLTAQPIDSGPEFWGKDIFWVIWWQIPPNIIPTPLCPDRVPISYHIKVKGAPNTATIAKVRISNGCPIKGGNPGPNIWSDLTFGAAPCIVNGFGTCAKDRPIFLDNTGSGGAIAKFRACYPPPKKGRLWWFNIKVQVDPADFYTSCYDVGPQMNILELEEPPTIRIEKTHDTYQGQYEYVSITLEDYPLEMGGFDFLIGYDASALAFVEAQIGDILEDCGWEYFSYRHGVMGTCGDACPKGLMRIIAMAETADGPSHPSCYGPPDTEPHELAAMRFFVSNDRNLNGQYVPIYFFWDDCGDNAISSVDGETLYIDRGIYDFQENLIWSENDDDEYPEDSRIPFVGAPDYCLNTDPDKPSPYRFIDFINGGIDIIPSDSIDARGDVNLNGVPYEIADAVAFTNYFVYGQSAFTVNPAGQIAATEINGDGIVLTVADLVYLIRVILGNAPPIPRLAPVAYETEVNLRINHTAAVISVNSPVNIGAAQYVLEYNGYTLGEPHLINGASDMTLKYTDNDGVLKILVYSMEDGRIIEAGPENIVAIPIRGSGSMQLMETQLSDEYGRMMTIKTDAEPPLPRNFVLQQNYPNPFNAETHIIYELPKTAMVRIDILNTMGQLVAVLCDGRETAGVHRVSWDGLDIKGNHAASGIFIYRLVADGNIITRKMTLLK